ncbi:cyclic lactone autoinducer peptide [Faecalibacterium prausnitzii]|nr:cyclic lactone autoinducer peptide [Faecalibacterium prausnitzii]
MSGSSSWRCVIGKAASAIALAIAKASVNSTCFFTAYQPEIPKRSEYK